MSIKYRGTARSAESGAQFVQPKSKSGTRKIMLPPAAIDKLRAHRATQRERLFALGIRVNGETTVACDDAGAPIQPQAFGKWAARRGVKPHNIRHAHLSKLANSGVPIAAVARRAGHADIRMTLQTYIHPDEADDADAAAVASALIG
jgi:integrase